MWRWTGWILGTVVAGVSVVRAQDAAAPADGWYELFDGRSLAGWTASEHPESFQVVDGQIACHGPRAHLFYTGPVGQANFKNFEFSCDVLTRPGANSGVYFHTKFQDQGFPQTGFEVQVNNSYEGHGGYRELKKTGSLYGIRNQYKTLVQDNQWFTIRITVRGPRVLVDVNGTRTVDYVEPETPVGTRRLGRGTFALQGHDPDSQVAFKNLRVRPLPDNLPPEGDRPVVDDLARRLADLSRQNFPLVNYHAHLKGGLTIEELLAQSHQTGIYYGIAPNCGKGFGITDDAGIEAYLKSMAGQPVFLGMQAEGREWVSMFSPQAVARFDYVFTDAMTLTDHRGQRVRLWIKDEFDVTDKQAFMDRLVDVTVGILTDEPIDIYVNPTYLPGPIAGEYDTLWTPERMERVIAAAVARGVAIEINAKSRLPSPAFLQLAKSRGAKFAFGVNNGDRNLGRLDYCLDMVQTLGLTAADMFVPKPDGQKPVQVRGFKKP